MSNNLNLYSNYWEKVKNIWSVIAYDGHYEHLILISILYLFLYAQCNKIPSQESHSANFQAFTGGLEENT